MKKKKKIVVFASGNGSSFENICKKLSKFDFVEISKLYCNDSNAFVIERAKKQNIESFVFQNEDLSNKKIFIDLQNVKPNLIVLAGFLKKIPTDIINEFKNKIINIHHSFLPAFIGAKPYQQAFERGVKIIGATAHFVTNDLDEGPIITQNVIPVDHSFSAVEMAKSGRDVEKSVLSKALGLAVDDRIFVYGNRTVIL